VSPDPLSLTAEIDGRTVGRSEVLAWESRRCERVFAKLGMGTPSGDLARARRQLVERKLELGHRELERKLARELWVSARSERVLRRISAGRRQFCAVELIGGRGSAEAMPTFYRASMEAGDEAALLGACPDHYVLCQVEEGREQVIETTGGSPLAARIFLDDHDTSSIRTPPDDSFPVQWVAVGRGSEGGQIAGGIRHQFRDEPAGFRARLVGEFPAAMPPYMCRAHKWHLACEFSNWIEAANSG
jgi:hypothetical protein